MILFPKIALECLAAMATTLTKVTNLLIDDCFKEAKARYWRAHDDYDLEYAAIADLLKQCRDKGPNDILALEILAEDTLEDLNIGLDYFYRNADREYPLIKSKEDGIRYFTAFSNEAKWLLEVIQAVCVIEDAPKPFEVETEISPRAKVKAGALLNNVGTFVVHDTHNVPITFGKHNGKMFTAIPVGYLKWMVNERTQMWEYADAEIKRRGHELPTVEISAHAINRASLRVLDIWEKDRHPDEGLHSWLMRMTNEALEDGKQIGEKAYVNLGMKFVIDKGEEFPSLMSVLRE